jgi:hypothetical protein
MQIEKVFQELKVSPTEITPRLEITLIERGELPRPRIDYWVHQALVYDEIAFPKEKLLSAYKELVEAGLAKPRLREDQALREVLKFRGAGAKRLDCLLYTREEVYVIEAKPSPDLIFLDQLAGYMDSLQRDLLRPWLKEMKINKIIAVPYTTPAFERTASAKEVRIIITPPP